MSGHNVFTCSEDHTVRMWDVATAELLAVAYGPNAFRCIAMQGEDILAGNDGGEVLTFSRAAEIGMWPILADPENAEFAQKLAADLQRRGVRTTVRSPGPFERPWDAIPDSHAGMILVVSDSTMANVAFLEDISAFERARKPVLVARLDETDASEPKRNAAFRRYIFDFRDWRDPYRYADALATLLAQMKRGQPVPG